MDKWILIEVKEMLFFSTLIELYNIIKKYINYFLLYKTDNYKLIEMVTMIFYFLFYNYFTNKDYFTKNKKTINNTLIVLSPASNISTK